MLLNRFQSVFGMLGLVAALCACDNAGFTGSSNANRAAAPVPATAPTGPSAPTASTTPNPQTTAPVPATTASQAPLGAVTKGNFTVWAEPSAPAPFEDYQVFIRVTLPLGTSQYGEQDLTGAIDGTDTYVQSLADSFKSASNHLQQMTPQFSFQGTSALLGIWVPGTYAGVVDTVQVHSDLLSESQNIQIDFQ